MPFAKSDLAVVAATRNAGRTALLLAAAQAIRKRIVGGDVIHLGCRLVIPTAEGLAAVDCDHGSLIAGDRHNIRIVRINPKALIVVTSGRAPKSRPRFAAIRRFPGTN